MRHPHDSSAFSTRPASAPGRAAVLRCTCDGTACGLHRDRCVHREGEREFRGDRGATDLRPVTGSEEGALELFCRSCREAAHLLPVLIGSPQGLAAEVLVATPSERLPYAND